MFTRSITNAPTMVREQRPKRQINWSPQRWPYLRVILSKFFNNICKIQFSVQEEHWLCKPEQFVVVSCLLEALLTLQRRLESRDPWSSMKESRRTLALTSQSYILWSSVAAHFRSQCTKKWFASAVCPFCYLIGVRCLVPGLSYSPV